MKKLLTVATALAMFAAASPAFASVNSSTISITSDNHGAIHSDTSASAKTGGNTAGGSNAGQGGTGSTVVNTNDNGSGGNGGSVGGAGGNGGTSGDGGLVVTGNATADAGSFNALNSNGADVSSDGGMNSSDLTIGGTNGGCVTSDTRAKARTGGNNAQGSNGGNGGAAGTVVNTNDNGSGGNSGSSTGNGGTGGASGLGGEVRTGAANSSSGSINVVNTNLVRVRN